MFFYSAVFRQRMPRGGILGAGTNITRISVHSVAESSEKPGWRRPQFYGICDFPKGSCRWLARSEALRFAESQCLQAGRGMDSGYPLPPAQTRADAGNAHGSYLGWVNAWGQHAGPHVPRLPGAVSGTG
jgi:hypothetical protein